MAQLIFRFNSQDIIHNYQQGEQISSILQSFCHNFGIKRDNFAFLCNGTILNDQSTIQSLTPNNNNQIIILVTDIGTSAPTEPVMRKSNSIICPQCKESIVLSVRDFKVSLFQCKNGHKMDNIPLSKFNETQNIDISKIFCDICKCSKASFYNNLLSICTKCKCNICRGCENTHDRTHKIIDYENKNFICEKDFDNYNSYCTTCKKGICMICEMEHNNHDIISFGRLMGNINEVIRLQEMLKHDVDKLKNIIKGITSIFNKVSENLDAYFDINKTIISTIQNGFRNYEQFASLNEININMIQKELDCIINNNNVNNIINGIFNIYKRMENINVINLQKIIKDENEKENDNIVDNNQIVKKNMISKEQISVQNNNPLQKNLENKNNNNNIINSNSNNSSNNDVINKNEINENKINNNIINKNINNNNAINNNQINNNHIVNNNIINTNINSNNQINNNNENMNRTNNNIIDNNNNNNNNNINNNQNSNQNTDQGNNNINLNLRPNTNSEELINNLLNIEMENLIRQDIDANTPLISESSDIASLLNEYRDNSQYLNSVQTIANKYKSIRKIRRDGNCFYRGFIYRIFEYISVNNKTELYNKMLRKIDEARDLAKKNLLVSNLIDEFYNAFIGEFCSCFNSFTNTGVSCKDYLDKLFHGNNKEKCNYLVLFIRYSIAEYLRENKILYEDSVEASVGQDYNNWLINEVEPIDKEADQFQILACVNFFDIRVKIENLTKDRVWSVTFPESKDDKDIFVTFLFTPGHYDLLYDN